MIVEPGWPNQCGLRSPVAAMWAAGLTKVGSSTSVNGRSRWSAQHSRTSETATRPSTDHHTALVPRLDADVREGAVARVSVPACTRSASQGEDELKVNELATAGWRVAVTTEQQPSRR